MKKVLYLIIILVLFNSLGYAATYWVDDNGSNNWSGDTPCSGETPLSGSDTCSLSTANSNANAGDLIYLRGGTYSVSSSGINPKNSGTSGSRITYRAYNSESVNFVGASSSATCVSLRSGQSYITVDDVNCTGFKYHMHIINGDYNEIANSTFEYSSDVDHRGSTVNTTSSSELAEYNWIHNNTFQYYGYYCGGNDEGVLLEIAYDTSGTGRERYVQNTVIEDNIFQYGGHHVVGLQGSHTIFRNNYLQNQSWDDCGSGNIWGNRILYMVGQPKEDDQNLIEGNMIAYGGLTSETDQCSGGGTQLSTGFNIYRYNIHLRTYTYGLRIEASHAGQTNPTDYNAIYNNTFWYSGYYRGEQKYKDRSNCVSLYEHAVLVDEASGTSQNLIVNNLFYDNNNTINSSWDIVADRGKGIYTQPQNQDLRGNWGATDGDPKLVDLTGSADPENPSEYDLSLQSDSDAINAGTYLTTATYSDADTVIVGNPYPFQPGWGNGAGGGAVVYADSICFTESSTVVDYNHCSPISSINYSTAAITLTSNHNLESETTYYVWLYKNSEGTTILQGAAPDVGAYEYDSLQASTGLQAPTGLKIIKNP